MHWLLFLLLLVTTILIFYQDLSTRSVLWFLFPIAGILGIINTWLQTGSWLQTATNSFINAGFLLVQFVLLKIFYLIKANGKTALINHGIGLGDILFLLASCCFFSPINFLLFYCSSLLFALATHLLYINLYNGKEYTSSVPLAGYMAVSLIVSIGAFSITKSNPAADEWLLRYFIDI